jgi:guanylate kinase
MSVSVTTRPKRPGEVSGVDYHFIDASEFNLKVNRRELLERAKVFGHYYGTPTAPVEAALAGGRDVLFDIDWQGTQQLAESAREDLVSIFILPPSTRELERRLRARAQDSAEEVGRRMAKAADEMSHWAEYDYIIVNRDLERSLAQVQAILQAERLRRERQIGLHEFVKGLREGQ